MLDYSELPFYHLSYTMSETNKERVYREFPSEKVSLLSPYHQGRFLLNGTSHIMEEFMVRSEAKDALAYPQGFLIMEAGPGYFTEREELPSYELRFCFAGKGELQYAGRRYTISPGEGFWIDCRRPHRYAAIETPWVCSIFHLDGMPLKAIYKAYCVEGNVTFSADRFPDFERLQLEVLRNTQALTAYRDYKTSAQICDLLTGLLLSRAAAAGEQQEGFIPSVCRYLKENIHEDITLETLCQRFAVSRNKLCTDFRSQTGFSVKNYLLILRINHARQLLRSSTRSVEQISEACGFHDTAHFIQMFKKQTGLTPLQFRKRES